MSMTQIVHRGKHMYGDRPAIVFGDRTTSFHEFHDEVARCAAVFAGLEPAAGASVGILSANCDRAIIGFYGAMWAGIVPNYLNVRWSAHELSASIDDFAPFLLLADDSFLEMALVLQDRCPCIRHVVYIGDKEDFADGVSSYVDLVAVADPIEDRSGASDDLAFLNYTGGTTGKGKGVMCSHASHTAALMLLSSEGFISRGSALMAVPLFHITGIGLSNGSLMLGNTLYVLPAFDPVTVLEMIQQQAVVQVLLVPTMLQMLLHHPDFGNYDLKSLKYIRYGGSPIDESLLMELKAALPQVDFMQAYGQTEGVPASLLHDCDHTKEGVTTGRTRSAGIVCYGTEVEIRDADGNSCPRGVIGEITLRGPQLMMGYLNNPEQTEKTLQNGWLLTGDAGYLTDNDYLHVVDRVKDMIISGGENVYSVEVEGAIYRHVAVEHCAVVGLPDDKWGERVHAEVVLKSADSAIKEELTDHCREYLAGYKLPRSIQFVEVLPLTAVGKVDKVAIRNKYADS